MSVNIVTAHVSQNRMSPKDVIEFIKDVHATLASIDTGNTREPTNSLEKQSELNELPTQERTVSSLPVKLYDNDLSDPVFAGIDPWLAQRISARLAKKMNKEISQHPTVFDDKIICLEDGAEVKLLKPYLRRHFNMTADQYIEKWNLDDSYPMAPPGYVAAKRAAALQGGLGRQVRANRESSKSQSKSIKV